MPPAATIDPLRSGDQATINVYTRDLRRLYGNITFGAISARNEDAADAKIEDLFVEPALSAQHYEPEDFDQPEGKAADWKPPETETLTAALLAHERLVILGDPGTGKSTAVQWITASLADPVTSILRQHLRHLGEFTPLPIILRDLPPALFSGGDAPEILWKRLLDEWLKLPVGKWLASTAGLLDRLVTAGRALFLIDGIDELPGLHARKALRDALWWAWENSGSCRWVTTSRIIGYEEAPIHEREEDRSEFWKELVVVPIASCFYLAPFDDERVKKFSTQWFARLIGTEEEAKKEATRFCGGLADKPDTRTLARVPNFLTLMALAWRSGLELPDGRARLYRELSLAYLENIDRHKYKDRQRPMPPPLGATAEVMERWLGALAWDMQIQRHLAEGAVAEEEDGKSERTKLIVIERQTALAILTSVISETTGATDAAQKAEDFLLFASARSGLFLPRGAGVQADGQWGFLHLSFQEYFAACYLRDKVGSESWAKVFLYRRGKWPDARTSVEALREYADRRMWHETLLFLFELLGLGDPERPASRLRAILGAEDPTESEWPELPPAESVNAEAPSGQHVAQAEWMAVLAVDLHVALAATDRTVLLRCCWEWQLEWQERVKPGYWVTGAGVVPFLCSRPAAAQIALAAFIEVSVSRKPRVLSIREARGVTAVPVGLLHAGLEQIVFSRCPALPTLPDWPALPRLKRLGIGDCPAITCLPNWPIVPLLDEVFLRKLPNLRELPPFPKLPKLQALELLRCPSLTDLPDLGGLENLRYLHIEACPGLPTGTAARLRRELPNCKIFADEEESAANPARPR